MCQCSPCAGLGQSELDITGAPCTASSSSSPGDSEQQLQGPGGGCGSKAACLGPATPAGFCRVPADQPPQDRATARGGPGLHWSPGVRLTLWCSTSIHVEVPLLPANPPGEGRGRQPESLAPSTLVGSSKSLAPEDARLDNEPVAGKTKLPHSAFQFNS